MSRNITPQELAQHNTANDCWVAVHGEVYNVTNFLDSHPGGASILLRASGKDASQAFDQFHNKSVLTSHSSLHIGHLSSSPSPLSSPPPSFDFFVEGQGRSRSSPFFKEHHEKFRNFVREWVDNKIKPNIEKWEEDGGYPLSLHEEGYQAGISGASWPVEYGGTPPEGGFDPFMDLVLQEELSRCGGGWLAAYQSIGISLPTILQWGSEEMKERVARPCITGKKIICLCVTEPQAGSDVAQLQTTATKEGNYYIVSGEKKFITSGMTADYFVVACRTGGKGMRGVSLLLLERGMEGITRRKMKTGSWASSNTAYLSFDRVKVAASNLIGAENEGFSYIMLNFNHERLAIICMALTGSRAILGDTLDYAHTRKTFNRRLIDNQVIRHKVANMVRELEAATAWMDQLVFQMAEGSLHPAKLGASMALLKVHSTRVAFFVAKECSQIVGGNSILTTGKGANIERFYRDLRVLAIGGGSEEVMLDLGMNVILGKPHPHPKL